MILQIQDSALVDGASAGRIARALRAQIAYASRRDGATPAGLRDDLERLECVADAFTRRHVNEAADRLVPLSRDKLDGIGAGGEEFMTTTEASRRYGLDVSYWRRAAGQGRILARRGVRGWELDAESAETWARQRRRWNDVHAA